MEPKVEVVLVGRRVVGALVTAAVAAACLTGPPAMADGGSMIGSGNTFYLNDTFGGTANITLSYGNPNDSAYVGDWDGDGRDTLLVRRGSVFYARNSNTSGVADTVFQYGDPGDVVIYGDWDGNGSDTPAVRRDGTFYLRNSNSTGVADVRFSYGDPDDVVVVGDWDGNGTDTLAVRRGNVYLVRHSNSSGVADLSFAYGNAGDVALSGDWDGNGADSLAVRRGNTFYLRNSVSSGTADRVVSYGNPTDFAFAGDWNGDRIDTLGVRRPPALGNLGSLQGVDLERIPTAAPVVALTFDGGASDAAVQRILTTLDSRGVKGTFFVTGDFARTYPRQVASIAAAGHRLGHHSDTHLSYVDLADAQIVQDLARAESVIVSTSGAAAKPLFRFPFGARTAADISAVNGAGYVPVRWTVDTLGWRGTSGGATADAVLSRVLATLQPGQIVLMHVGANPDDGTTLDADALPRIIDELRGRGYAFVGLDAIF